MYLPTRLPGLWTVVFESYTWFSLAVFVSGDRIGIDCGGKMHYYSVEAINKAQAYYVRKEYSISSDCLGLA